MYADIFELPAKGFEKSFDEIPETGDKITIFGKERVVLKVDIVNESKVMIYATPKREVRYYDDYGDPSMKWEELSDKYLEEEERNFNDKGSLGIGG